LTPRSLPSLGRGSRSSCSPPASGRGRGWSSGDKTMFDAKTLLQRYQPKQTKVLALDQQLCTLRYSPDGKLLAGASFEGAVRRWDALTDAFTELPPLCGHHGWVQRVAFSPDGQRLYSVDSWGRLSAWPIVDREPKALWDVDNAHAGWIRGLALSP